MSDDKQTTHFGFEEVSPIEKTRLVGRVFSSVADNYDVMNDLMSLGIHRLWKRHFIGTSGIRRGSRVLDLAGGTGDIAALLVKQVGSSGSVVLSDINPDMLNVGRERLLNKGITSAVDYVLANAEHLPFNDGEFDAVTIAFGLRNVTDKLQALKEMHRVLKPGGQVLILEFSKVTDETLARLYDQYSFSLLPKLGEWVAKDADSYRYLAESIRQHPGQEALADLLKEAGFDKVRFNNMSAGIVAIHRGYHV